MGTGSLFYVSHKVQVFTDKALETFTMNNLYYYKTKTSFKHQQVPSLESNNQTRFCMIKFGTGFHSSERALGPMIEKRPTKLAGNNLGTPSLEPLKNDQIFFIQHRSSNLSSTLTST